jgi:antirestriction protein
MNKETTMPLTGDALLTKIAQMREVNASNTEIALACNYIKDNGNPAFVEFYTAMIKAKGLDQYVKDEPEFEVGSKAAELAENYPKEAIQAFCDYWDVDDLEYFTDAYQGEFESGADFAKDLVESCYDCDALNLPYWVTVRFDWEDTWDNLRDDYIELDGFIFSLHW